MLASANPRSRKPFAVLKESWLRDDNLPVSLGMEMRKSPDACEIYGCREGHSQFSVTKADNTRRVCRRCAQEMIALHGWSLIDVLDSSLSSLVTKGEGRIAVVEQTGDAK